MKEGSKRFDPLNSLPRGDGICPPPPVLSYSFHSIKTGVFSYCATDRMLIESGSAISVKSFRRRQGGIWLCEYIWSRGGYVGISKSGSNSKRIVLRTAESRMISAPSSSATDDLIIWSSSVRLVALSFCRTSVASNPAFSPVRRHARGRNSIDVVSWCTEFQILFIDRRPI